MARPKRPFSVYRRRVSKKKKWIYYAKISVESGYLRISTGQTSKYAAEKWAEKYVQDMYQAEQEQNNKLKNITVGDYVKDFWDHEGKFAQSRRARLKDISNGYLDNCAGTTNSYIVPFWGKYRIVDLTPGKIDRWVLDLVQNPVPNLTGKKKGVRYLAPATINKILQIFRVILDQACREEIITENPAKFVKPVNNSSAKSKGVLTPDEIRMLLNPHIWDDYRHYAINLLTLATGIRISEVRGLQVKQIHPEYIEVHTAWSDRYGLKEPKWGSKRDIPITKKIYDVLQHVIETTRPKSILFYGTADYNHPMSKSVIEKKLYKTLEKIGIDENIRKQRNLTFHSHRHTLNTILRSEGVHDAKVRMITGHRQESMTELYTHFGVHDFKEVADATRRLFA